MRKRPKPFHPPRLLRSALVAYRELGMPWEQAWGFAFAATCNCAETELGVIEGRDWARFLEMYEGEWRAFYSGEPSVKGTVWLWDMLTPPDDRSVLFVGDRVERIA